MRNAIRNVVAALRQLERAARKDEPFRREAATIREAFEARAKVIKTLRRQQRRLQPKPDPAIVELFIPRFEDCKAFSVQLDLNKRGLVQWQFWRDVWNGTA